jgi:hypothetical protein
MGSLSRTDRCFRFIDEFTTDIVAHSPYTKVIPGLLYEYLGIDDMEMVKFYIHIEDKEGVEWDFTDDHIIFEPDMMDNDAVELVAALVGCDEETAKQRLQKADLI